MAKPSTFTTKHVGPGGVKCACCRDFTSVKFSRTRLNRLDRRATKAALKLAA